MHIENTPEIQGMVSNNWFWDSRDDGKYESVFLEIEINKTNTTESHSFANIREYSCIKDENEVLFSIGSLFQIVEIDRLFGGQRHIKLKLVEEDNEIVESILKHYERITENFESPITLATIGNLLPLMGLERKKEDYHRLLLKELPIHHPDIESIKRFSMISVTIIGSDLIRYFQERIVQINQKTFHYFTQQMNCCSIRSLTKYVNQKHFKPAKYFIFVIGTKTLQYEYPSTTYRRMIKVYNKFETAYSKSTFFIATLPLLPVCESKTFVTHAQRNIQKYNRKLLRNFNRRCIIDVSNYDSTGRIHLNVYGINNLNQSIDNHLHGNG